ncbi:MULTISPECIES: ATP-binding protein [Thermomonospora]|uniref:ATP-binding protein n=1 Tax=Thermomonospora TaxID=2019 RepID=UPI00030254D3|nr:MULTISPECIES: ATP-binding protein [Thermomonospora]
MKIKRLGADGRRPHGRQAGGRTGGRAAAGALAWELAGEAAAVSRARALTRRALALWGAQDPGEVDDVVLMVDELVTNAVVHGTGPVRLRLRLREGELVAEVGDDSPLVPRPAGAQAADWSERGRGLLLVAALAAAYGSRVCGHGKVVWFSKPLRLAPEAPRVHADLDGGRR